MTLDISKYRLLTPKIANLNIDDEITLYHRNGEIDKVEAGDTTKVDLATVKGIQTTDFNLVFSNHDKKVIKGFTEREDLTTSV